MMWNENAYVLLLILVFLAGCATIDEPSDDNGHGSPEYEDTNGDDDNGTLPGDNEDDDSYNGDPIDDDPVDTDPIDSDDPDENDDPVDDNDPSEIFWSMLDLFASLYDVSVEPIEFDDVGHVFADVEVGSGGNRYMDDGEVIDRNQLNTVTSQYYSTMVERFNRVNGTSTHLNIILPMLGMLDAMDEPVNASNGELVLTYDEAYGHHVDGHISVGETTFNLTVLLEDIQILDRYEMIVYIESDYYEYYYRIERSLTRLHTITHMTRYLDDTYGFMELSHVEDVASDNPRLFTYRYDGGVHRRWLYDMGESHTSIYYHNDTTGTEIMQYLNDANELLFEYEDYAANQPLIGTHKARWFLSEANGWDTITFEQRGFMGSSSVYHFDALEIPRNSSDLRIEAKNYKTIEMVEGVVHEDNAATWVYRIDGGYGDDRLFNLNPDVGISGTAQIKSVIDALYDSRSDFNVFDVNMMDLTNEDVIASVRFVD